MKSYNTHDSSIDDVIDDVTAASRGAKSRGDVISIVDRHSSSAARYLGSFNRLAFTSST